MSIIIGVNNLKVSLTMLPLYDLACILLEMPFSRWPESDRESFSNCEIPMPVLNINKISKIKDKVYNQNF